MIKKELENYKSNDNEALTLDELRILAKDKGYKLVKIQPHIKLLKCPYCKKKPNLWFSTTGDFYACKCMAAKYAYSDRERRIMWNNLVKASEGES